MISNNIKHIYFSVFEKYKEHVVFAYLFGSVARDNVSSLSDIDIAVYLQQGKGRSVFDIKLSLYSEFCRVFRRNDIDIVALNTASNIILLDEIIRSGLVLLDRDPEMREEFENKILHNVIDFKEQRIAIMGI